MYMDKDYTLTSSLEDYLEAIYNIAKKEGEKYVRITDIALLLKRSKPTVNTSIKTLSKYGYIEHEPYGKISLTEKGLAEAKNIAVRHEIIKRFLVEILKIDEETADLEACKIEHTMSSGSMNKFGKYIKSVLT